MQSTSLTSPSPTQLTTQNQSRKFRVAMVGDQNVGKTQILNMFMGRFNEQYQPTRGIEFFSRIFNTQSANNTNTDTKNNNNGIEQLRMSHKMMMTSLAGRQEYLDLFDMALSSCICVVVVFSLDHHDNLQNVSKWIARIRNHREYQNMSIILCGSKYDLIENAHEIITDVNKLAQKQGIPLILTSTKNSHNKQQLIQLIIEESVIQENKLKNKINSRTPVIRRN